jgi:HK97 family phage major capsid protein
MGDESKKNDDMKKLDAYIEGKMDSYMAAHANDPDAQKNAVIQGKYAEALGKALIAAEEKGTAVPSGKETFGKFALAVLNSDNDKEKAFAFAKKRYGENALVTGLMGKALESGVPSSGGFAVPEVMASEIIGMLNPNLAYMRLGARKIGMPNGNLTIPRFDARAVCTYTDETGKAGATQPKLGQVKGSSKKLTALIPISNDLILNANADAEAFVRDDVIMSLQLKKDYTAFYGDGTANTPAGITKMIVAANKIGSASEVFTGQTPAIVKGLLMSKNIPGIRFGWVFNGFHWTYLYNLMTSTGHYIFRDEMNKGTLLGDPFVVSNQVYSDNMAAGTAMTSSNYGDLFYGDFSELIEFVQTDMELAVSKDASFVDASGNTVSCFQNDMTALRVISRHDFGLRHDTAFVQSTNKYSAT